MYASEHLHSTFKVTHKAPQHGYLRITKQICLGQAENVSGTVKDANDKYVRSMSDDRMF